MTKLVKTLRIKVKIKAIPSGGKLKSVNCLSSTSPFAWNKSSKSMLNNQITLVN